MQGKFSKTTTKLMCQTTINYFLTIVFVVLFIAPLPIEYDPELPCYKNMLKMMHMPGMKGKTNTNIPKAQAIKDATMAHFININLNKRLKLLHFNGSYHSDNKEGILWYLKKLNVDDKSYLQYKQ